MQGKVADLYTTLYSAEKATWMAGEAIQALGGVGTSEIRKDADRTRAVRGEHVTPHPLRSSMLAAMLVAAIAAAATATVTARAQGTVPAVVPDEIDGQINGKRARFVASGDDVLIAAAEADRLGLPYLEGKRVAIGGTPLWLVTLASVTVAGTTRLAAPAGVVPSIAGYFAALRTNPAEAVARSREIQLDIGGRKVTAYDLGTAGVLMAPDVAESAGLDYKSGKRQDLGPVAAWLVEPPSRPLPRTGEKPATIIVAEPLAYLRALMAGAGKPP